ncbi:unnamed protein product, partial [Ascophyllum nodosum]
LSTTPRPRGGTGPQAGLAGDGMLAWLHGYILLDSQNPMTWYRIVRNKHTWREKLLQSVPPKSHTRYSIYQPKHSRRQKEMSRPAPCTRSPRGVISLVPLPNPCTLYPANARRISR